jgi:hypothetical protein
MIYPNDNAISMFFIGLPVIVVCGIITRARFKPGNSWLVGQ